MNKRVMQRIAAAAMSCCLVSNVFGSMTVQAGSEVLQANEGIGQQGNSQILLSKQGFINLTDISTYAGNSAKTARYAARSYAARQLVKEELVQGIYLKQKEIPLESYKVSTDEIASIMIEVLNENPEMYWATGAYSFRYYVDGSGNEVVVTLGLNYTEGGDQAKFEQEVAKILSYITDDMSDLEKAKKVHDYMVLNYEYSKAYTTGNFTTEDYSIYGLLVNKEGVCQAYAQAYKYLMKLVGVPCEYVVSNAMNHMWNMIQINNEWYHVDATWDDPVPNMPGRILYNNFLKSDAQIEVEQHYSWEAAYTASSTVYDHYSFTNPGTLPTVNAITSFKLKKDSMVLSVGEKQVVSMDFSTLLPTGVTNRRKPAYISLRENIVSVDQMGNLTANAEGQAVVLVIVDGITRACIVNVEPKGTVVPTVKPTVKPTVSPSAKPTASPTVSPSVTPTTAPTSNPTVEPTAKPVTASSIQLSKTKLDLFVGESTTLKATIMPGNTRNKVVSWTSSNAKVASVSNQGKITTHKNGTAVITATMQDGSKVKASCKVTVKSKITYKLNGGKNGKNPSSYNGEKAVVLNKPTRKGYVFKGWYSDKSLKKSVSKITKGTSGNKVFYAKWEKVSAPKKAKVSTLKSPKSKQFTVSAQKIAGAAGYEVTYSTSSKFTKGTTKTVTSKNPNMTVSKLKSKKQYYVKVRVYKTDSTGKKYYGSVSAVKKVKIK